MGTIPVAHSLRAGALVLLAAACGSEPAPPCTAILIDGLKVTVDNGATGDGGCLAKVWAADGPYVEQLACDAASPGNSACVCTGAEERAGVYQITVEKGGTKMVQTATVSKDSCHVHTQEVTFTDP